MPLSVGFDFRLGYLATSRDKAANDTFDRDTAGAVAWALSGAYWGEEGIPGRWKKQVEKERIIMVLADELIEIGRELIGN